MRRSATLLVAHLSTARAATMAELCALGLSEATIRRHEADGLLERLGSGVYGLAGDPLPDDRNRVGARLLHPGSVLSHQTAAELLGLPMTDRLVHLTAGPGDRRKSDRVVLHRTKWLPPTDVAVLDGHTTTSPARTVCDLAAVTTSDRHYGWLVQEAMVSGVVDEPALAACHRALSVEGRRGTRRRRRVFDDLLGHDPLIGASRLEHMFLRLVRDAGIEGVVAPFEPPWFDGVAGIVGAAVPRHLLIVELDGRRWHTTLERFENDRARDRRAIEAGWRVLRFTWDDVVDRPESVIASLDAACRQLPSR